MAAILNLSIRTWLIATTLLISAETAPWCRAAIACPRVINLLEPCYSYVTGRSGNGPSVGCCDGVKRLYNEAKTKEDRQSVCRCLKDLGRSHSSINVPTAAKLPGACGVHVPYNITLNINCSKVTGEVIRLSG